MELPQVNPVQLQPLQAGLKLATKVFRPSILDPAIRTGALEPALGGDDQAGIGVQSFSDQLLGDVRTVGVGRIEEVHSQLDCPLEHADGFITIPGRSPDTFAGQPHGAESHTVHREIATHGKGAGRGSRNGSGVRLAHEKIRVEGLSRG